MSPVSRRALLAMSPLALASPSARKEETQFAAAHRHIDAFIPRYMQEWNTPGLALAITIRQKLVRLRSVWIFRRRGAHARIGQLLCSRSAPCLSHLPPLLRCSFTRTGSSTCRPRWFDTCPGSGSDSKYPPFAIHHVLSHTSGIPATAMTFPLRCIRRWRSATARRRSRQGHRFAYSNVGYEVLAHVIEAAAGEPYGDYLCRRIFKPLGMANATPLITNDIRPLVAIGYPMYYDDRPPHSSHPLAPGTWVEWGAGDGNIAASATDLTAFLRMLLNGGAGPHSRVLSEDSFRQMTAHAVRIQGERFYGYGISVRQEDGHTILGHSGGMVGYSGIMLGDMDCGLGVVMLSNGAGNPMLAGEFALNSLRAAAAGKRLPPPPDPPAKIRNAAAYAGTYTSRTERSSISQWTEKRSS